MPFCGVLSCSTRYSVESKTKFFTLPKFTPQSNNLILNVRQKLKNKQFEAWIRAINRTSITATVRICFKHFSLGKPGHWCDVKNVDWYPHIDMGYDFNLHSLDYLRQYDIPSQKNLIAGPSESKVSSLPSQFSLRNRIAIHGSDGVWHCANLLKVDSEDLVQFEKNIKSEEPARIEWMEVQRKPKNSSHLERVQAPVTTPDEKCLPRWTESKCTVTVQKVLQNSTYKVKTANSVKTPKTTNNSAVLKTNTLPHIPKFDLSELNLVPVPKDGEWCCNWVNDIPVGIESYLECAGYTRPTVIVEDWRLPPGWTKHACPRPDDTAKWDVVLIGPTKKRFRSRNDVKLHFKEKGEVYDPDIYDFSIHKKRAKDLGLYIFTDKYKEELKNRKLLTAKEQEVQLLNKLFCCTEPGCNEKFRKENQLQIHMKHYHDESADPLGICSDISDLAYQNRAHQPIDESIVKNEIPDARPVPVAIYRAPYFEHSEQVNKFFISYVDSKYD